MSSLPRSSLRRTACDKCRALKLRCLWDEPNEPERGTCIRCARLGLRCEIAAPRRAGRPRKTTSPPKVGDPPAAVVESVEEARPPPVLTSLPESPLIGHSHPHTAAVHAPQCNDNTQNPETGRASPPGEIGCNCVFDFMPMHLENEARPMQHGGYGQSHIAEGIHIPHPGAAGAAIDANFLPFSVNMDPSFSHIPVEDWGPLPGTGINVTDTATAAEAALPAASPTPQQLHQDLLTTRGLVTETTPSLRKPDQHACMMELSQVNLELHDHCTFLREAEANSTLCFGSFFEVPPGLHSGGKDVERKTRGEAYLVLGQRFQGCIEALRWVLDLTGDSNSNNNSNNNNNINKNGDDRDPGLVRTATAVTASDDLNDDNEIYDVTMEDMGSGGEDVERRVSEYTGKRIFWKQKGPQQQPGPRRTVDGWDTSIVMGVHQTVQNDERDDDVHLLDPGVADVAEETPPPRDASATSEQQQQQQPWASYPKVDPPLALLLVSCYAQLVSLFESFFLYFRRRLHDIDKEPIGPITEASKGLRMGAYYVFDARLQGLVYVQVVAVLLDRIERGLGLLPEQQRALREHEGGRSSSRQTSGAKNQQSVRGCGEESGGASSSTGGGAAKPSASEGGNDMPPLPTPPPPQAFRTGLLWRSHHLEFLRRELATTPGPKLAAWSSNMHGKGGNSLRQGEMRPRLLRDTIEETRKDLIADPWW